MRNYKFCGWGHRKLAGGDGDDIIWGGRGDDEIDGGAGDDLILDGHGDDTLIGGTGDDTVFAGHGDDVVDGGADDDWIWGGHGDDTLSGGAGHDTVLGGHGDDVVIHAGIGGGGLDAYHGGHGRDTLEIRLTADEIRGDGVLDELLRLKEWVEGRGCGAFKSEILGLWVASFEDLRVTGNPDAPDGEWDLSAIPPEPVMVGLEGERETGEGDTDADDHPLTYTVSLDRPADADVEVAWSVTDPAGSGPAATPGADFGAPFSGTVVIAAGETEAQFQIMVFGDTEFEGNETFKVEITGVSGNAVVGNGMVETTIVDDDPEIPPVPSAFTDGNDYITFSSNSVDAFAELYGVSATLLREGDYLDGTQYDAGGGDDIVMLTQRWDEQLSGYQFRHDFHGGDGNDILHNAHSRASLYGDAGDDQLFGHTTYVADILDGGAGNDHIEGRCSFAYGGAGDDFIDLALEFDAVIDGGAGNDTVHAGSGADRLIFTIGESDGADLYNGHKAPEGDYRYDIYIDTLEVRVDAVTLREHVDDLTYLGDLIASGATVGDEWHRIDGLGLEIKNIDELAIVDEHGETVDLEAWIAANY